jgi:hypothetical protein
VWFKVGHLETSPSTPYCSYTLHKSTVRLHVENGGFFSHCELFLNLSEVPNFKKLTENWLPQLLGSRSSYCTWLLFFTTLKSMCILTSFHFTYWILSPFFLPPLLLYMIRCTVNKSHLSINLTWRCLSCCVHSRGAQAVATSAPKQEAREVLLSGPFCL